MFTHPDTNYQIAKYIQHERHLAAAQSRLVAAARPSRPPRATWPRLRWAWRGPTVTPGVVDPC